MGRRRRRGSIRTDDLLQGVLLVDKPAGLTSHDVVQQVKEALRLGKVGHGGTLDPFATGLLPLMLNGATRLMPQLQARDKVYEAVVRLGLSSDTMDPTGEVSVVADASGLDEAAVREAVAGFVGPQQQKVPRFAAARVDGKHLYEYARSGEEVEQPVKDVVIHSIDVLGIERSEPGTLDLSLRVHCGSGTYVRALADDLGRRLGCGGLLHSLRRTRIGTLDLEQGLPLRALIERSDAWRAEREGKKEEGIHTPFDPPEHARRWQAFLGEALVPVDRLLGGLARLELPEELVRVVVSGQPLRKAQLAASGVSERLAPFRKGEQLVVVHPDGLRTMAIVRAAVARDSLARRDAREIVLEVERVLR